MTSATQTLNITGNMVYHPWDFLEPKSHPLIIDTTRGWDHPPLVGINKRPNWPISTIFKKDILAYSQWLKPFLLGRILGKIPTGPENQQTPPLFFPNSASGKSCNSKAWWKVLVDAEVSEEKKNVLGKKRWKETTLRKKADVWTWCIFLPKKKIHPEQMALNYNPKVKKIPRVFWL